MGGKPLNWLRVSLVAADLSAVARLVRRSAEREGGSAKADVAQLAERVLGKDEVTSSILVIGSKYLEEQRGGSVKGRR